MYYILIFIGCVLIGLGIYKDKNKIYESILNRSSYIAASEELSELKERISSIEKIIFFDAVEHKKTETNSDEYESITNENKDMPSYGIEKYKLLCQYEGENYAFDEICSLLNMKKGEVLLLKNLYKNYQS